MDCILTISASQARLILSECYLYHKQVQRRIQTVSSKSGDCMVTRRSSTTARGGTSNCSSPCATKIALQKKDCNGRPGTRCCKAA